MKRASTLNKLPDSPVSNHSPGKNDPSSLLPSLPESSEILIIRLRSLGDLVLETPAIAALKAWRPDLRISVLAEPRFAAVLENNPAIANVLLSRGLVTTALGLRRSKFAVVFNQHGGPRSAMLTGASDSPSRVGWKGYQYSFFYNVQVPDAGEFYGRANVHTIEHRMSQFYAAGLPRNPIPAAQVFPHADAVRSVAQKLAAAGISPDQPYAVLQPGARLAGMRWPVAKFAEIARWLRANYGIASVVNCAPQDDVANRVRTEIGDAAFIPESLDLRELIGLIAGTRLFVGNDSGPAHIASALQRPTVVIFSLTDPVQWRPLHPAGRVVGTGGEFAHPRGDKAVPLNTPRSINSITVDEVREACAGMLGT